MTTNLNAKSVIQHDVKAYFDSQAGHWDSHSHHEPGKLRRIIRACDLHSGQRVLDVACGTGVLFPWLLAHDPSLLMGIDLSERMTEIARAKHRDKRLKIVTADYYHLAAGAFDRIIIYNAYPHFFDKMRFAEKTRDLLIPGGRFVVAHNKGRESLNEMHKARGVHQYSVPLKAVTEESRWFDPYFEIDNCIDAKDIFILSGKIV